GVGPETINGGTGDDFIKTGDGDEQISGDDGNDLLTQSVGANQTLTDSTLTGRGSDNFSGIERVQLVDNSPGGGFSFNVSARTSPATLIGSAAGNDSVTATADADMTLADGSLKTSIGGSFLLTNITRANLASVSL